MGGDTADPDHADRGEPKAHDRPEHASHRAAAQSLKDKQDDDDRRCDRDDQASQRRRGDVEALDRGKNRDRRRDHAVAEEQRCAEDPEHRKRHHGPAPAGNSSSADQGDQRHDPAFTVVVGVHNEQDVGDGDDDRHRPEDQRDDPENALRGRLDRMRIVRIEDRLLGIQRARADVSEDNPESTNRKSPLGGITTVHAHQYSPSPLASKEA